MTAEAQRLMPGGVIDEPAAHSPVVSAVTATAAGSMVTMSGMATDPDNPRAALAVHAYEGKVEVAAGRTDPASHAFTLHAVAHDGQHAYRVVVDNIAEGSVSTSVAAGPVSVDGDPFGSTTSVTPGTDVVTVSGWETDPNASPGMPPRLAISIDGGTPTVYAASRPPSPVAAQSAASYDVTVTTSPGTHRLTVTYLHSSDGRDTHDSAWTVTVAGPRPERRSAIGPALLSSVGVGLVPLVLVAARKRSRRRSG